MPRKTGKFKSENGRQTMTVTIDDVNSTEPPEEEPDVEAYQLASSETFQIVSGDRILTITIAE
jgi:hypothetical protein